MSTSTFMEYCGECGSEHDIEKAIVGNTNSDGTHDVEEYHLECGHVLEPTDATLSVVVVYMLQQMHPETITVNGDVDEEILDEQLDSENDLGWRGYVWEALGMVMAVFIVLHELYQSLRREVGL